MKIPNAFDTYNKFKVFTNDKKSLFLSYALGIIMGKCLSTNKIHVLHSMAKINYMAVLNLGQTTTGPMLTRAVKCCL